MCADLTGRPRASILQDNSSQTQDEAVAEPESKEKVSQGGQGEDEKGLDESKSVPEDPSGDRKNLKRVNKRLLNILLEIVKTTGAVEETIGRHVVGLLDKSGRRPSASKVVVWSPEPGDVQAASAGTVTVTDADDAESCSGAKDEVLWSEGTEEDLDVPLQLTEADFPGTGIGPEEEAQVLNIGGRLQSAVEKLLEAINETSNQLEHARAAQTELVRESLKRKQETTDLLRCQEELQERLNEEAKAREHLAVELSKAEGLLDGYTDERVFLEKQMQEKTDLVRHLEQELQSTGNRLQELEQERQLMQEEKELLSRQKLALKASAAPAEQRLVEAAVVAAPKEELLEETEKLLKEKIEVQRQAEKDSGDLHKQVKVLEVELEEQVNRSMEIEQEKNAILEDLRQKNLSLEKQLEKTRRFLDEQAVDREHERDVFQQEIQKLEQQLKMPQRHQPVNEHQSNEVEKLEGHLKEKTDKCSELLLCKEQLQRDVQERNEEIEKLECRIRELEQALLISADTLQKVEDRRPSLAGAMPLEAQLQVEREAIDRKEKEITNLVEQLEQFREELENKNEEVQQLHMQLEIQRKESATRLQELEQENKVLKDENEMTQPEETSPKTGTRLKQGKMDDSFLSKDQEILLLNEQISKLQAQLEFAADNQVIEEKNEQIKQYKSQIKCLKSDQERLKKNSEEEIEKLNEVIEKLQEELSHIEQKETVSFTSMAEITEGSTYQSADAPPLIGHADVDVENMAIDYKEGKRQEHVLTTSSQLQETRMTDETLMKNELEATKAELQQVKEELERLRASSENSINNQLAVDMSMEGIDETVTIESLTQALMEHMASEALLMNAQEVSENTIRNLQCQVQDLQKIIQAKESQHQELANSSQLLQNQKVQQQNETTGGSTYQPFDAPPLVGHADMDVDSTLTDYKEGEREKWVSTTSSQVAQSSILDMESSLQQLQETIKEKDLSLKQCNEQIMALKEDAKVLNETVEKLKTEKDQKIKDSEISKIEPLEQPPLSGTDETLVINELEVTKAELQQVKEELERLRASSDNTINNQLAVDTLMEGIDETVTIESLTQALMEHMASEALLMNAQEVSENTICNLQCQVQDLQKTVQEKESQIQDLAKSAQLLQNQNVQQLNETTGGSTYQPADAAPPDGHADMDVGSMTEKDQKIKDSEISKIETLEQPPLSGTDEALIKNELEATKAELQQVKEELERLRASSENSINNQLAVDTSMEGIDETVTIESLTQALMEHMASEALLMNAQEASENTIRNLQCQVQDLQKTVQEKESKLQEQANSAQLRQNQNMQQLNETTGATYQPAEAPLLVGDDDVDSMTEKDQKMKDSEVSKIETLEHPSLSRTDETLVRNELEATKAELLQVKEELERLRASSDNTINNQLAVDTLMEGIDETVTVESLTQALMEHMASEALLLNAQEASENTIRNLQCQVQDLQKTVEEKESQLKELANRAQLLQNQEVTTLRMAPKHDDMTVKCASTNLDGVKAAGVTDLEQALREKEAALLNIQEVHVSLDKTARANIDKMELQELQKVIEQKDLELQQFVQQENLYNKQMKEIEQLNEVVRTLQQELAQHGSEVHSREETVHNERISQKTEIEREELVKVKAELDKAKADLAVLKEELSKVNLANKYGNVDNGNSSAGGKAAPTVTDLEEALRDKTAELLTSQAMLISLDETTQATIHSLESELQELQKGLQLKDSELSKYVNQKDLIDQQTKEIERLNILISLNTQNSEDAAPGIGKDEALRENEVLQNKARLEGSELVQIKMELKRTKMELAAKVEEITKMKLSRPEENISDGNKTREEGDTAHKLSNLEQALREKTADLLASQALLTSLEETSQATLQSKESQIQELRKAVQLKDSDLLQYLNQQNILEQQTKEIEHLNGVIDSLKKQLAEVQQKTAISAVQEGKSRKLDKEQMNGGEMTFMKTLDSKAEKQYEEPFEQLYNSKERIHTLDSGKRMSDGDVTAVMENKDQCDWMIEALRDQNTQLLANQSLFTSMQETMQSTIDSLEIQLEELQKVIKEKDMEILLHLEEIEMLKEQVKVKADEHDHIMLAMEDSLREKVAAALVSDAQLKAIQLHTKHTHVDGRSSALVEESKILQAHGPNTSQQGESESVSSVLNLQLLDLEKQLSDLHEQLQVERDQVILTNQLAAEKEKQLVELQQLLKDTKGQQSTTWTATGMKQEVTEPSKEKAELELQLQTIAQEAIATKEQLCHYREMSEKLREELMVKESSLIHLEEDLREVKKCLSNAEEKLAFYMKREIQEEELQNMSDIDLPNMRTPDWTTLEKATSSSQTDKVSSVNNSNQTPHVPRKHVGVQNELEAGQMSSSSDEVAELMEQYTEKIGQMQELHAAEILDMEARHISEAESLRREQYTIVQALTDECDALKAVIEALKSPGGGVPDSALSTSYHFTDAASSDVGTECDWSQGTCDVQSFDQIPEGLRGDEDDIHTELIPDKIKDLLRAVHQEGMQVLSLTEATSPDKESPFTVKTPPWREERKAMLETIASLKDLIAKMQIYKDSEAHTRPGFHDLSPDWRGELLRAIQEVFQREQDVLMSAFQAQLAPLGKSDANALLNQMQHRLQEQGIEQINAMDCIQNADRRSLLLEIQDLRAQLTSLHSDPGIQSLFHGNTEAGGALYIQQEQASHSQELHMQLRSMKAKAGELQEQLGSERLIAAEIKNELALTKMELESNLKLQHKHFKELESLRTELKKKREELDSLNEALENEQKKCRELQYTWEKEQTKGKLKDLREKEDLEDLQVLLDEQKLKTVELGKQLEEEKKLVKELQEQMESAERAYDAAISQERSRVLELQIFLDAEKARSAELSNTLEYRQDFQAHVQNTETDGKSGAQKPADDLLKDLQSQLDSKHSRIVELVNEVEGYKLECVQLRQSLEEERQNLKKELEAEREASRLAAKQVEELTYALENLQRQEQERAVELKKHQAEEKHLRETIQRLQNSAQDSKNSESETREHNQNAPAVRSSPDLCSSVKEPQTGSPPNLLCPDPLSVVSGEPALEGASFSIDYIKRRLQQVAAKLRHLAAKSSQRVLFERADDEDLTWSQNSIQEILSQLEHVAILSLQGQNLVLPSGISANTLTEKLLTQNAELTGYVSRLTEEKKDLQNSVLRLEGEVSRYRARGSSGDHSTVDNSLNTDTLLATEREVWSREKLSLHKSLKQTEAELSKVRAELRNEIMQRDFCRDSDNTALKRVYGKYLRSESFRKALIYQKKYLLLLLGGFQECEEATLALIARMGGQPTYTDLEVITHHSRAFTRFRSAVRVSIAIFRMKFLVRRWQRATISTTSGTNRNSCGQGNEVRTDSTCHPARSMERISTCRSQSGFNSPQSTVNSQHRYISASDASPCFHLQHYDPDRALTDYIARLEALQKRLGSVPSGSSANTTHYSIRR